MRGDSEVGSGRPISEIVRLARGNRTGRAAALFDEGPVPGLSKLPGCAHRPIFFALTSSGIVALLPLYAGRIGAILLRAEREASPLVSLGRVLPPWLAASRRGEGLNYISARMGHKKEKLDG